MQTKPAVSATNRDDKSLERRLVEDMFARAEVRIDGDRPFDIRVHDPRFFRRALRDGQLGLGEAYMDGWWSSEQVAELTARFIGAGLHKPSLRDWRQILYSLKIRASGIGGRGKAFEVGRRHYDLGNDLFAAMLDPRMIYSCGYWNGAATLAEAQENKLDLICRKIDLKPGMRVLDIGCGWGGWAKFAAERYGASVTGVTVSAEQQALARQVCAGLPVDIQLRDYRAIDGSYDRVVTIGMVEHIGHRHYGPFMRTVDRCLRPDGLMLLHSIFANEPYGAEAAPWLNEYIFPNAEVPSLAQLLKPAESRFVVEAIHHFDGDYERTLAAWLENFRASWSSLAGRYDERFRRMWEFYLMITRGIFLSRTAAVRQIVFSKNSARPGSAVFRSSPEIYEAR